MRKITRDHVLQEMRTALVKLWLLDNLGEIEEFISNKSKIGEQISDLAIKGLQTNEKLDDKRLEGALISMCDLGSVDPSNLYERIVDILNELCAPSFTITDQDKMKELDMLLSPIVEQIKAKQSLEEAAAYLILLRRVSRLAAQLAFSGDADLSKVMDTLIRDFEHADENSIMRSIFNDIQNDSYLRK
ncbi:MAG: hypothetical protein ACREOO_17365 [bacterium]